MGCIRTEVVCLTRVLQDHEALNYLVFSPVTKQIFWPSEEMVKTLTPVAPIALSIFSDGLKVLGIQEQIFLNICLPGIFFSYPTQHNPWSMVIVPC